MSDQTELDLAALRYVAGEMAPDEIDSFESRLAVDQSARESVARMVLIGSATTTLPREAALQSGVEEDARVAQPAGGSGGWRFAAAAVLVFALGIAVWNVFWSGGVTNQGESAETGSSAEEIPGLIASWVDFDDLSEEEFTNVDLELSSDAGETSLDAVADTPAWMMQALGK